MSENIKKIALVTGASRGIGRAIAIELAKDGITIIGTATTKEGSDKISEYLKPYGGEGAVLQVKSKENIEELFSQIATKFGDVNIIVNNAGITRDNLLMRMKEEEWDDVIATNLKAPVMIAKTGLRAMTKQRFGRIVNIVSVVGFMGNAGQPSYCSAKGGLVAFTKSMAQEYGSRNITVNCVAPGFIETDMTSKLTDELRAQYISNIPLGRLGVPEDIANAVKFLVSDGAGYITGSTVHVNGGLYM